MSSRAHHRSPHRDEIDGASTLSEMIRRCEWAPEGDPLYLAYHDEEWGVPSHDDRHLFEMLTLEGAQAGLSWATILRKREGYRAAFAAVRLRQVARFDRRKVERLLRDPGIVRNRLKVESTVNNARRVLEAQEEFGSFDAYIWQFVGRRADRRSLAHARRAAGGDRRVEGDEQGPQARGFRFVGPTICYAFMQAAGMVNDHVTTASATASSRPQHLGSRRIGGEEDSIESSEVVTSSAVPKVATVPKNDSSPPSGTRSRSGIRIPLAAASEAGSCSCSGTG